VSEDLVPLKRQIEPISMHAQFTEEQVNTALLTLALAGSYKRAMDQLAAIGIKITIKTLCEWKTQRYPIRYADLVERNRPELEKLVVANAIEGKLRMDAIQADIADRLHENVPKLDVRDLSQALRNVSSSGKQELDTYLVATGRPTQTVMHRSVDENLMLLKGLVEGDIVDGEEVE
jgi:hypothetical protein